MENLKLTLKNESELNGFQRITFEHLKDIISYAENEGFEDLEDLQNNVRIYITEDLFTAYEFQADEFLEKTPSISPFDVFKTYLDSFKGEEVPQKPTSSDILNVSMEYMLLELLDNLTIEYQ